MRGDPHRCSGPPHGIATRGRRETRRERQNEFRHPKVDHVEPTVVRVTEMGGLRWSGTQWNCLRTPDCAPHKSPLLERDKPTGQRPMARSLRSASDKSNRHSSLGFHRPRWDRGRGHHDHLVLRSPLRGPVLPIPHHLEHPVTLYHVTVTVFTLPCPVLSRSPNRPPWAQFVLDLLDVGAHGTTQLDRRCPATCSQGVLNLLSLELWRQPS